MPAEAAPEETTDDRARAALAGLVVTLQMLAETRVRVGIDAAPEDTIRRARATLELHDLVGSSLPGKFPLDARGVRARGLLRRMLEGVSGTMARIARPEA